jgi:hypothetical protein
VMRRIVGLYPQVRKLLPELLSLCQNSCQCCAEHGVGKSTVGKSAVGAVLHVPSPTAWSVCNSAHTEVSIL